jgi:hypothetical protein
MPKKALSGQKHKHNPLGVVDESSNKRLDKLKAPSPCGVALNWNHIDNEIEVLVGAHEDYPKLPRFHISQPT